MSLSSDERVVVQSAIEKYITHLKGVGLSFRIMHDFAAFVAVRRTHGKVHLNQVFDPQYAKFSDKDFWLLAENRAGEAIATYCIRHFAVNDFYDLIRSQKLWFGDRSESDDTRFVVSCDIPPFGGQIAHGGGLWVRRDCRGSARLAIILPRLVRAITLRDTQVDHDSAMIRDDPHDSASVADRKAAFMGIRIYGFARVRRFVNGWFPPEGRNAVMHLCHATRDEAMASLADPASSSQPTPSST